MMFETPLDEPTKNLGTPLVIPENIMGSALIKGLDRRNCLELLLSHNKHDGNFFGCTKEYFGNSSDVKVHVFGYF
jgi:hypothetical protein